MGYEQFPCHRITDPLSLLNIPPFFSHSDCHIEQITFPQPDMNRFMHKGKQPTGSGILCVDEYHWPKMITQGKGPKFTQIQWPMSIAPHTSVHHHQHTAGTQLLANQLEQSGRIPPLSEPCLGKIKVSPHTGNDRIHFKRRGNASHNGKRIPSFFLSVLMHPCLDGFHLVHRFKEIPAWLFMFPRF
ncbi:MAG: hypothetical protein LKE39_05520 [Sphaerochaeta sp.]|nr:hypothetical protein [Sphaerochaeta sp.]